MNFPKETEYAEYYKYIIKSVPEGNLLTSLKGTLDEAEVFLLALDEAKGDYRYAPEKWSIKEVVQHILDTERVMAYRAMRFARGDKKELIGFDQDLFAQNADVSNRTIADLFAEFKVVRQSTIHLFKHLTEEESKLIGNASGFPVSVRALAAIIIGHAVHHLNVIKEKY